MKKIVIKIIAASMAVLMLSFTLCGCGGQTMKVTVGVKLGQEYIDYKYAEARKNGDDDFIITQAERTILNDIEVRINYTDDDPVTVLRALTEACANTDTSFEADGAGQSINTIKNYSAFTFTPNSDDPIEGFDETLYFFWAFTINGKEPDGRAGKVTVNDGDVIIFTLSAQGDGGE